MVQPARPQPRTRIKRCAGGVPSILNNYIDEQLKLHNLTNDKLALIGFSQGCMMSLFTAVRRAKPCAGVVGYSGALVGAELLKKKPFRARLYALCMATPIRWCPLRACRTQRKHSHSTSINVESHTRSGLGHGIDPEGIELAQQFLKKHLL